MLSASVTANRGFGVGCLPPQQEEQSSRWVTPCSWLRPLPWAVPALARPQSSALALLPMGTRPGTLCSPLRLQDFLQGCPEGVRAELLGLWESCLGLGVKPVTSQDLAVTCSDFLPPEGSWCTDSSRGD